MFHSAANLNFNKDVITADSQSQKWGWKSPKVLVMCWSHCLNPEVKNQAVRAKACIQRLNSWRM